MPEIGAVLELPARLLRGDAAHGKFLKDAMRKTLITHHFGRIPGHFQQPAHGKYGYKTRDVKYIRRKLHFGLSGTDLVKTGASRDYMSSHGLVSVGGTFKTELRGNLKLRFDFRGGTGRFRKPKSQGAITIAEMRHEVATTTAQERVEISRQLAHFYVTDVKTKATPRIIIRTK